MLSHQHTSRAEPGRCLGWARRIRLLLHAALQFCEDNATGRTPRVCYLMGRIVPSMPLHMLTVCKCCMAQQLRCCPLAEVRAHVLERLGIAPGTGLAQAAETIRASVYAQDYTLDNMRICNLRTKYVKGAARLNAGGDTPPATAVRHLLCWRRRRTSLACP